MRDEIAKYEWGTILDAGFPSHNGIPFNTLPDNWWSKVEAYYRADHILSIIRQKVEGLENPYPEDIFIGAFESIKAIIPDEHERSVVMGIFGRYLFEQFRAKILELLK